MSRVKFIKILCELIQEVTNSTISLVVAAYESSNILSADKSRSTITNNLTYRTVKRNCLGSIGTRKTKLKIKLNYKISL